MGGRKRRTPTSTIACCATRSCLASTASRDTVARGSCAGRPATRWSSSPSPPGIPGARSRNLPAKVGRSRSSIRRRHICSRVTTSSPCISTRPGCRDRKGASMHHSRLSTFVIDCRTESAALGRQIEGADGDYRQLAASSEEPIPLVQKVDHPSRIHLDIETDDQEAEVKRLEALGARRVARVKTWWVLEAPTGQRFCVINPQRGPLAGKANKWP